MVVRAGCGDRNAVHTDQMTHQAAILVQQDVIFCFRDVGRDGQPQLIVLFQQREAGDVVVQDIAAEGKTAYAGAGSVFHGNRPGEFGDVSEQAVGPFVLIARNHYGNGLSIQKPAEKQSVVRIVFGNIDRQIRGGDIDRTRHGERRRRHDVPGQDRTILKRDGRDAARNHRAVQCPAVLDRNDVPGFERDV